MTFMVSIWTSSPSKPAAMSCSSSSRVGSGSTWYWTFLGAARSRDGLTLLVTGVAGVGACWICKKRERELAADGVGRRSAIFLVFGVLGTAAVLAMASNSATRLLTSVVLARSRLDEEQETRVDIEAEAEAGAEAAREARSKLGRERGRELDEPKEPVSMLA